ncbi:MAG: D-amino-acid transaminase [Sphingomonadales bacterium]
MARFSYVNGSFLPHEQAVIPIEDRGFQFADAVYEVVPFFNRTLMDFDPHFTRLERSLSELSIKNPLTLEKARKIFQKMIELNEFSEGIIYLQITRGTAIRDHGFPDPTVVPNVVATAKALDMDQIRKRLQSGVGVILVPENRWRQVEIKSTSLLGNVLAKEEAKQAGCYEAVFVDLEGNITEGTSTNAWMVNNQGVLKTRRASGQILRGITRGSILEGLQGGSFGFEEASFSRLEAEAANEFFLTSATSLVMPVVRLNDKEIGNGKVGPVTKTLQDDYYKYIETKTAYKIF